MTREDVIRMAREADEGHAGMECEKFGGGIVSVSTLERFAALVATAERKKHQADIEHWKAQAAQAEKWRALALSKDKRNPAKIVQKIQREAMELERDACAKVCEARYIGDNNREDMEAKACAAAIRARGNQ